MLFDEGKYHRIELPKTPPDPLKFRDLKRYTDRLNEAQAKTGAQRRDHRGAWHASAAWPSSSPPSSSTSWAARWGSRWATGLVAAARLAVLQQAALIVIPASGGARMQEGILSLMQMPRTMIAVEEVPRRRGCPTSSC